MLDEEEFLLHGFHGYASEKLVGGLSEGLRLLYSLLSEEIRSRDTGIRIEFLSFVYTRFLLSRHVNIRCTLILKKYDFVIVM